MGIPQQASGLAESLGDLLQQQEQLSDAYLKHLNKTVRIALDHSPFNLLIVARDGTIIHGDGGNLPDEVRRATFDIKQRVIETPIRNGEERLFIAEIDSHRVVALHIRRKLSREQNLWSFCFILAGAGCITATWVILVALFDGKQWFSRLVAAQRRRAPSTKKAD